MTEAELTNEQKESLYSCLRCIDEDEQVAYTRGWLDCMDIYRYQEFIEKDMIDKVCDLMIGMLNDGIIETRDIGKVNTIIRNTLDK